MNYQSLPLHLRDGMRRYLENRIETGSFLRACLENDLEQALIRQSDYSPGPRQELERIMVFLRFEAPQDAWGSPDKVQAWLAMGSGAGVV